ncbi:hypothetical protein D3C81_315330 [compost metagenome]
MNQQSQPQYREPRAAVIFRHTTACIRNSQHTDASFAQLVAETYMDMVAPGERVVDFHTGTSAEQVEKALRANAQLISRFRVGTVKLPVDIEEAWVAALPSPWGEECARELAQRYGFMGARLPELEPHAGMLNASQMSIEFGESLGALAVVMADGAIDARDVPALREARHQLNDLRAELETMSATVDGHLERFAVAPALVAKAGAR